MNIGNVIQERVDYAARRAAEAVAEANKLTNSAIGAIKRGECSSGEVDIRRANAKRAEAEIWARCVAEVLEPIVLFFESAK